MGTQGLVLINKGDRMPWYGRQNIIKQNPWCQLFRGWVNGIFAKGNRDRKWERDNDKALDSDNKTMFFKFFPPYPLEGGEHQILTPLATIVLLEADVKKSVYKNAGFFLQISCFSLEHTNFLLI